MPKLKPSADQSRENCFNAAVCAGARRLGLNTDKEIASYLGINSTTYAYRMQNKQAWNYTELTRMIKRLRLTAPEILSMFSHAFEQ